MTNKLYTDFTKFLKSCRENYANDKRITENVSRILISNRFLI